MLQSDLDNVRFEHKRVSQFERQDDRFVVLLPYSLLYFSCLKSFDTLSVILLVFLYDFQPTFTPDSSLFRARKLRDKFTDVASKVKQAGPGKWLFRKLGQKIFFSFFFNFKKIIFQNNG